MYVLNGKERFADCESMYRKGSVQRVTHTHTNVKVSQLRQSVKLEYFSKGVR